MSASDKLFYWVFQNHPDWILQLQSDLPAEADGWRFSAPVLKQREHRLDGLFLPPPQRPELPAVLLEAQMAADPHFLRRLYAQSARLLEQMDQIDHWRVVVICPRRSLNFGRPTAVAEFLRERVHWIELQPAASDPAAPPLLQALALLVQPQDRIATSTAAIRAAVAGTALEQGMAEVIAAIVLTRFRDLSIQELCAMGGLTLEDFSRSAAYREIFGQGLQEGREEGRQEGRVEGLQEGRQEGRKEGRQEGELAVALRLLHRRCGALSPEQEARIRSLPLPKLEELAEALLEFRGIDDLKAWLQSMG